LRNTTYKMGVSTVRNLFCAGAGAQSDYLAGGGAGGGCSDGMTDF
jgi:hypothetical protein